MEVQKATYLEDRIMPFNSNSGYEFSESGIAAYGPRVPGVYGLYSRDKWIYIDMAPEIQSCLYALLRGRSDQSTSVISQDSTFFIFEKCDPRSQADRKAALVSEYRPCCNPT